MFNFRKNNFKTHLKGFTLVELIVVIIILAILAAVALPRFTNIQRDARIAKLNAAKGSVAAATTLLHAAILAKNGVADTTACADGGTANNSSGATGTVCTENGRVNLVFAYPAVNPPTPTNAAPAILAAAGLTTVFNPTIAELNAEGYGYSANAADATATVATFQVLGGTDSANCSFTYTEAVAANTAPTISGVTTTGC